MTTKARHSAGSSRGGQFAATHLDEVEVNLGDLVGPIAGARSAGDPTPSSSAVIGDDGLLRPGADALSLPSFADHGYAPWHARDAAQAAAAEFAIARFDHQVATGDGDDADLRALSAEERESLMRAARAAHSAQSGRAVSDYATDGRARRDRRMAKESYDRARDRVRGPFGKKALAVATADLNSAVHLVGVAERTHLTSLKTKSKIERLLIDLSHVTVQDEQTDQDTETSTS